jgi:hypothetical protein
MISSHKFEILEDTCIVSHKGQIKPYFNNPKYKYIRSNERSYYKCRPIFSCKGTKYERVYNAKVIETLEIVYINPNDDVEVCWVKEPVFK